MPAILVYCHAIRDVGSGTKLSGVSIDYLLAKLIRGVRHFNVVTIVLQLPQGLPDARKDIQIRSRADVAFVWWKTKKHQREL